MPGLGAPVTGAAPELVDSRKWRVGGFPNLLIFYQPGEEQLFVIRILHAAQNWLAELERD